jgi:hypothetical protein
LFGDFFRRAFQILALASIATVIYLDILAVPGGAVTFLKSKVAGGGIENRGIYAYTSGLSLVPTLFVPNRWSKYQLDISPHRQDIQLKLPLRYSRYLRLNDLFYAQVRLKIEGEIPEASGYAALKAMQYLPGDRDKLIEESIRFIIADYFIEINADERNLEKTKNQLQLFLAPANLPELQRRLESVLRISWYKFNTLELSEIYMPDSQLYAAQTQNLGQVAAADRASLLRQIDKETELALQRKRNLEDLAKAEKMGVLIQENPDILEYYKIEKLIPNAGNVVIDSRAASSRTEIIQSLVRKKPKRGQDGKGEKDDEAGGEIGGPERDASKNATP